MNKEYLGFDKQTHMAEGFDNYTVLSLWDTFRAENPLLTLIAPDKVNDLIQLRNMNSMGYCQCGHCGQVRQIV